MSDSLPETMLPTEADIIDIISDTGNKEAENFLAPKQTIHSIDDLLGNVSSFVQQFKSLQREFASLRHSYKAQRKELERSRAEYHRKVEEWRRFKEGLMKRHALVDKSVMTCDSDSDGDDVVLTQDTASLLRLEEPSLPAAPTVIDDDRQYKRMRNDTPPGFWEVNFTPAHRS